MSSLDILGRFAGGERLALILFAVMSLLAWHRPPPAHNLAERYKVRAWIAMAGAVLVYSPAHAAWLLGLPAPRLLSRLLDIIGTGMGCWSFILSLAARGLMRGLSPERVRRGLFANLAVLIAFVGMALCLTR